jgi:hypothetical protein
MRISPALAAGASVAALVLLPACGSDTEDASTSGSSSTESGRSGSSGSDDDVGAFCTQALSVFTGLNEAFNAATEATQVPALLQRATSSLQAIDPPAAIADAWNGFAGDLGQLSQAAQGLDLSTSEGQQQFLTDYHDLMAASPDQDDVDQFVAAHCSDAASPAG